MKLDLMSLKLTNFMGVRDFYFEPNGANAAIYAENGKGKSTLDHACQWLLFDKNANGQKDFALKTLDRGNNVIHHLDHAVEGTFRVDGKPLTLQKVFAEKWTQKRGSATKSFTGHETTYLIDGVPTKKSEYDATVKEIAPENIFKLLTNPAYFNTQMKWQDRRRTILDACGDITDVDVIASNDNLKSLPEILDGKDMDKFRDMITAKKKKINEELKIIPERIDENYLALPDVAGIIPEEITQKVNTLKKRRNDKDQQISRIEGGGEVAEKVKALRETEGKLLDLQNIHRAKFEAQARAKQGEYEKARERVYTIQTEIGAQERLITGNADAINELQTKINNLRDEWHVINARTFEFEQSNTCPTCNQSLPAAQLEEAREKAQADFNRKKAGDLENINHSGKTLKTSIDELTASNKEIEKKLTIEREKLATAEVGAQELKSDIDNLRLVMDAYAENPAYVQLLEQQTEISQAIADLKDGSTASIAPLKAEIGMLENEIASLEVQLAQVDQVKRGQKRIEELGARQKELAAEYERLEGQTFLCEEFTRAKVAMLDERINSKFKLARFKMFDTQVNGGLVDCCETLCNGVPYGSGLNDGHKILVGLDIINVLAEHYNFYPVIFVDNAQDVTSEIQTHAQQIQLVTQKGEKTLRVEYQTAKETRLFEREAV